MHTKTRIELAVPWTKAREHLPKGLVSRLEPYLVDRELSNLLTACLVFDDHNEILGELLSHVQDKTINASGPGATFRLFGKGGPRLPLLRLVRRWTVYDFEDLASEPVVQLLIEKQVNLVFPLSQYYRVEIEIGVECPECGRVVLQQQASLRVRGHSRVEPVYGDAWATGDDIVKTNNHEVVISDQLKQLWPATMPDGGNPWLPVEAVGSAQLLWQVRPQGLAQVSSPPTPLQVRARCSSCDRPVIVAVSTATGVLAGQVEETVYEEEPMLSIIRSSLSEGDFWQTDLHEGRIRFERDLLERFSADPEPFYVRTASPFWLISNRMLRLLHDTNSVGWRCKPVTWT